MDRQPIKGKPHITRRGRDWRCSDPKAGLFGQCEGLGRTPLAAYREWNAARSACDYVLAA